MSAQSITLSEIAEIPSTIRNGSRSQAAAAHNVARLLGGRKPRLLATIGRGSSDHAATYLRYAFELHLGIPGSSISPSVSSLYKRQLDLEGALCVAVSQSGRSPDIVSSAEMARRGGATVIAIVNDVTSPLAMAAHVIVPIAAGEEKAVAATKSFVGASVAGLRLLATLADDAPLRDSLDALPEILDASIDESIDLSGILRARTAFVLGRGPSLGIAQEAALKLKEIVQFPAEAFSSAEVRHGPWQLGQTDCALIGWRTDRTSEQGQHEAIRAYGEFGHPVIDLQTHGGTLEAGMSDLLAPLLPLPSFYGSLVRAALNAGLDPDRPKLLRKVTETI